MSAQEVPPTSEGWTLSSWFPWDISDSHRISLGSKDSSIESRISEKGGVLAMEL